MGRFARGYLCRAEQSGRSGQIRTPGLSRYFPVLPEPAFASGVAAMSHAALVTWYACGRTPPSVGAVGGSLCHHPAYHLVRQAQACVPWRSSDERPHQSVYDRCGAVLCELFSRGPLFICWALHHEARSIQHVRINHRRRHIGMPKQFRRCQVYSASSNR